MKLFIIPSEFFDFVHDEIPAIRLLGRHPSPGAFLGCGISPSLCFSTANRNDLLDCFELTDPNSQMQQWIVLITQQTSKCMLCMSKVYKPPMNFQTPTQTQDVRAITTRKIPEWTLEVTRCSVFEIRWCGCSRKKTNQERRPKLQLNYVESRLYYNTFRSAYHHHPRNNLRFRAPNSNQQVLLQLVQNSLKYFTFWIILYF